MVKEQGVNYLKKYNVDGIPMLVVVREDGSMVTRNGVQDVYVRICSILCLIYNNVIYNIIYVVDNIICNTYAHWSCDTNFFQEKDAPTVVAEWRRLVSSHPLRSESIK